MEIPKAILDKIEEANKIKNFYSETRTEDEEKRELYNTFVKDLIPRDYINVNMDYYHFPKDSQVKGYLRNLKHNAKQGIGVFLHGKTGTGKTCFSYALIKNYIWQYILSRNPEKCHFTTFKHMQDSINASEDKEQTKRFYIGCSFLVIDEFCVDGELTVSEKKNLLEILNKRITNTDGRYGKPTSFTSNQTLENIKIMAGEAIHDRIIGNCLVHQFNSESRRTIENRLKLD